MPLYEPTDKCIEKPYVVLTTCCGDRIPDDCGYFGTLDEVREFIADIPEDESVSVYCFELVPIDAWKEVST
jgi:hypothetical protein